MELNLFHHIIIAFVAIYIGWGHLTYWLSAISIRWVPYIFIIGILSTLLTLCWILLLSARVIEPKKKQPSQGLKFIQSSSWSKQLSSWEERNDYSPSSIYPSSPPLDDQIDRLLSFILRDFIQSWFFHISTLPSFSNSIDSTIRIVFITLISRFEDIDLVGTIVSRVVPIISSHISDFTAADRAVRGQKISRDLTESEGLDLAIAAKFRNGHLHRATSLAFADPTVVQQQYIRGIVDNIIPFLLKDPKLRSSLAVNTLVKEIVTCAILVPGLKTASDPDTWNQLIEQYGARMLAERTRVKQLRAALDEHASQAGYSNSKSTIPQQAFPKLASGDSEKKFDKFIRAIRKCNALSEARKFRSEIAIQLRKESNVEGQDVLYIRRLETGKRLLDQKISQLGAASSTVTTKDEIQEEKSMRSAVLEASTLRDILYNATGLSYFMEYMDRQGLMRLVQFWVVVDGIRNPLEDEHDEVSSLVDDKTPLWTLSDRNDLAQINEAYLSKPELNISPLKREVVKIFLRAGKQATNSQYQAARKVILQSQSQIYDSMIDPYFTNFKKSDIWYKFLAAEDATVPKRQVISSNIPQRPQKSLHSRLSSSHKEPDLRKVAIASTDLPTNISEQRRSIDSTGSSNRTPLFDDDIDSEPMVNSLGSLDSDPESFNNQPANDPKVVDRMQKALSNIVEDQDQDQDQRQSLFDSANSTPLPTPLGSNNNKNLLFGQDISSRNSLDQISGQRERPSITSLGLIDTIPQRGVFDDDLFGDNTTRFAADDASSEGDVNAEDEIHEALPGDLGLVEAIDHLTGDIERLVGQEAVVDQLTKKAELTNNAAELRILRKSKTSLQREISRKELQRQQYIVQESDHSLYGRAKVEIKNVMVGTDEDGHEFAMYIVQVTRQSGDSIPSASWAVARRYSEFHALNKRLRARYPQIKMLDFPRRKVPVLKLQKDFLEKRRSSLEKYIQALLTVPAICRSRELRSFLSAQSVPNRKEGDSEGAERDFVSRIYSSVTDGMEEFLGNIPVLDQLSVAGANLISMAATLQSPIVTTHPSASTPIEATIPSGLSSSFSGSTDLRSEVEAQAELVALDTKTAATSFISPLCNIFLSTFALNSSSTTSSSSWLRGRAVVLVLQQLLGGTIERRVRDTVKQSLLSPEAMTRIIDSLINFMWPPDGNGPRRKRVDRTRLEKEKSRAQARDILTMMMSEMVGSVVGRSNATESGRRLSAMLGNERLNASLVFEVFDEIIKVAFGEDVLK